MTDFEDGYREGVKFATDFLRAVAVAATEELARRRSPSDHSRSAETVAKAIDDSAEKYGTSQQPDARGPAALRRLPDPAR